MSAALLYAQPEQKKAPDDSRPAVADEATREAQRQGQVALKPNAAQSPNQTVNQAVAFERYKDLAAEREAQKEAAAAPQRGAVSSENQVKTKRTMAMAKRKR
jgi:hypothetical protein